MHTYFSRVAAINQLFPFEYLHSRKVNVVGSPEKDLTGKTRNFHNAGWRKNYRGKAPPVLYYGVPLSRTNERRRRILGEDPLSKGPTNNFVWDPSDRGLKHERRMIIFIDPTLSYDDKFGKSRGFYATRRALERHSKADSEEERIIFVGVVSLTR